MSWKKQVMAILVIAITVLPLGIPAADGFVAFHTKAAYRRISLTGLGDSVMFGYACDCAPIPLAVKNRLQTGSRALVNDSNLAQPDSTLAELAMLIAHDKETRDRIAQSNIVIIMDGANDLFPQLEAFEENGSCDDSCIKPAIDSIRTNMSKVLQNIRQLRNNQSTTVIVLGYWNVFLDGSVGEITMGKEGMDWSRQLTQRANAVLRQEAEKNKATYIDLVKPFNAGKIDDLLAPDGDHPNQKGMQVIVEEILKVAKV